MTSEWSKNIIDILWKGYQLSFENDPYPSYLKLKVQQIIFVNQVLI